MAYELLTMIEDYLSDVACRSLAVIILARLGRLEDAVDILQWMIRQDFDTAIAKSCHIANESVNSHCSVCF